MQGSEGSRELEIIRDSATKEAKFKSN